MAENKNAQQVREITDKLEPVSYTHLPAHEADAEARKEVREGT